MTSTVALDDGTIREAVNLWCQDERAKRVARRQYGDISTWDVSRVTNMSRLFKLKGDFNDDISQWNVSNVTNMFLMFAKASSFNQPLNSWDVSNVVNASHMFSVATSFNQPLHSWNLKSVVFVEHMFNRATSFNQPLHTWDVSNVVKMGGMFEGASAFNQPLESWNTAHVRSTKAMFRRASSFNQPLSRWDVSSVKTMSEMFCDAVSFNQPLEMWDISNVKDMSVMFRRATSFNQSLHSWDFSGVENTRAMFDGATSCNPLLIQRVESLCIGPSVPPVMERSSSAMVQEHQCPTSMSLSSISRKRSADAVAVEDAGAIVMEASSKTRKRCHCEEPIPSHNSSASVQEVRLVPTESIDDCLPEDLPLLNSKRSVTVPKAVDPIIPIQFSPSIKNAFDAYLWETLVESPVPGHLIGKLVEILQVEGVSSFDIWLELTTDELKSLVEDHHEVHHHGMLDALLLMHREAVRS